MKYNKGDFLNISLRQRSREASYPFIPDEAITSLAFKKIAGARLATPVLRVFWGRWAIGYWHAADFFSARDKILETQMARKDFRNYRDMVRELCRHASDFLSNYSAKSVNFGSASDKNSVIFDAYRKSSDIFREMHTYAYVANMLDRNLIIKITSDFKKLFPDKDDGWINEAILDLSRNPRANFVYDQELELIDILLKNPQEENFDEYITKWGPLFQGSLSRGDKKTAENILRSRIEYFKAKDRSNLTQRKNDINDNYTIVARGIEDKIKSLSLPEDMIEKLGLLKDSILLKETRKLCLTRLFEEIKPLYFDLSSATGITPEDLSYLLPKEIWSLLLHPHDEANITSSQIEKEKENSLFVIENGLLSKRYAGEDAVTKMKDYGIYDEVLELTDPKKIAADSAGAEGEINRNKIFRGFVSSRGYVEGRVKVINSVDDLSKIVDGDILVTPLTTPEYVSIFSKIRGMITFDGAGLTSHPATLSREYKVPAILGVKELGPILKDGDEVIVDANSGVVILK